MSNSQLQPRPDTSISVQKGAIEGASGYVTGVVLGVATSMVSVGIAWLKGLSLEWAIIVCVAIIVGIAFAFERISRVWYRQKTLAASDQSGNLVSEQQITDRRQVEQLQAKLDSGCPDTRLHIIADEQAATIYRFVDLSRCLVSRHELRRPDPYIEFQMIVTNRSVYDIEFPDILGVISFHGRELTGGIRWSPKPSVLTWGNEAVFNFRQDLSLEDVAYLLSSEQTVFDFNGLQFMARGLSETSPQVPLTKLNTPWGPTNEALLEEFPALYVQATGTYAFIADIRDWASSSDALITIKVDLENPRKEDIQIEGVRLIAHIRTTHIVLTPRSGEIYPRQFIDAHGKLSSTEKPLKNLNNEHPIIILGQHGKLAGYFQFLLEDTGALELSGAPVTLVLDDKFTQRFKISTDLSSYDG